MMTSIPSTQSAQILFEGAHELLGEGRLEQIAADDCLSSPTLQGAWEFLQELERIYGAPGGRGLAYRIGRASFKYVLKYAGQDTGLRAREFHLLPLQRRLETGLRMLAVEIGRQWGQEICVADAPGCWTWRVQNLSSASGRETPEPCCAALAGLLHEFMSWASGGRYFRVAETGCRASGNPACLFEIEKQPLDIG
jgi:hypothetical protein